MRAAYWFLGRDWTDIMLLTAISIAGLLARITFVPLKTPLPETLIASAQFVTAIGLWLASIRARQTFT